MSAGRGSCESRESADSSVVLKGAMPEQAPGGLLARAAVGAGDDGELVALIGNREHGCFLQASDRPPVCYPEGIECTMADITSVDLARLAGDNLEHASLDLPRAMVKTFTEALMGAEADAVCGAPYGQPSEDRVNYRNGYRDRRRDTRAGTIDLAMPRLRTGSYFPDWLLERRRRSEQALISVVATSYLLGVSTRRVEKLAETSGDQSLSKSQVSELPIWPARSRRLPPERPVPAGGQGPGHFPTEQAA
jgi:hypothetical protein